MDTFDISVVFRKGSCYSWVNFYSGEFKLQQIYLLHFHFAPTADKKKS